MSGEERRLGGGLAASRRESEERLRTLLQASPDAIYFKDGEGRWLAVNEAGLRAFQLETADWHGRTDAELAELTPSYREALLWCRRTDEEAWRRGGISRADETIPMPDGSTRTFDVLKTPLFHPDGSRKGLVILGRDVTERVAAEEALHKNAFFDGLTGLPNRALLIDRLGVSLRRARGTSPSAVLYVDVDRFKNVNDGLGHRAGDALLGEVARRVETAVGPETTVARLAADEFVVVLESVEGEEEAVRTADRIRRALREPILVEGHTIAVTGSIGIAMGKGEDPGAEELLRHAHTALVRAKEAGRDATVLFDQGMHRRVLERLRLEGALRHALERGELVVHYQPLFELATGRIHGFEALVRWRHPDGALLPPDLFVPIAEETGRIEAIGAWVLDEACTQLRRLSDASPRPLTMSVNCSPRQLVKARFPDEVRSALQRSGVRPDLLRIEITESVFLREPEQAASVLEEIRRLGPSVVLDDFGTGFSSLSRLVRFAVDAFKIDKSFVGGLPADAGALKMSRMLVLLARSLDLSVTAEGVETREQLDWLTDQGCDLAQGFLLGHPVPAEEIGDLSRRIPAAP